MNEIPSPDTDSRADNALKRRLLNRIAVAAVVMMALLGSVAIFDAINAPTPPANDKPATLQSRSDAPVSPEPPRAESAAPQSKAAETATDAKAEAGAVAKAEEEAVAERSASPAAPPLQPLPSEPRLTRPATGRMASMRPSEPVPTPASPASRANLERQLTQTTGAPAHAPASRPLSQAGERQYALQLGVFGNLANAEDLRAKLELNGIPSSIEARVHAGPFKTQEEVAAARVKLKEIGLDPGLLLTMKAKRQ